MKYLIKWAHPTEDKPKILENVNVTKDVIEQLESQHNDKIITLKPIYENV